MTTQVPGWVKVLIRPRVLIPILLTAALLAFALSISDLPRVMGHIKGLSFGHLAAAFGLALGYLALKGVQFRLLLAGLDIHISWRRLLLAYSIGELTLPIPSGIYAQNYVLRRIHGEKFSLSAAATTVTLFVEGALVLTTLVILRIPHWDWLRPAILTFYGVSAVILALLMRSQRLKNLMITERNGWAQTLTGALRETAGGLRALIAPRILVPAVLLSIAYLTLLVAAFFVVGRGVGIPELTFEQATTIYFFSLGVTLLLGGVMTQLGVIEVAGLGAAQAWGYTLTEGLAMLLGFRLVWMGSVWLISGPIAWMLRGEFGRAAGNNRKKPLD
jgi:hypothetical protein